MAVFPSLDWFQKVRDVYNSDGSLHKGGGGACHTTAAFKVNDQSYPDRVRRPEMRRHPHSQPTAN